MGQNLQSDGVRIAWIANQWLEAQIEANPHPLSTRCPIRLRREKLQKNLDLKHSRALGEWESDGKVLAVYQGVENKGELIAKGAIDTIEKSQRANRGIERDTKFI